MKLLMFYAPEFWYKTHSKSLAEAPDTQAEERLENLVAVFYQCEAEDPDKRDSVLAKAVKNIKWLAGKFETRTVLLHSFGHLSGSKAPADFARNLVADIRARLERTGYAVHETPFGWFNEWKLHCAGESLAKVFKEL